ncbi:hypothetical protein ABZP36_014977 [Zizania latifolia]
MPRMHSGRAGKPFLILATPRVKEFVERYEAATHTKVWADIRQERSAELEKVGNMCDLLEKELRFMTVDDGEQYTVPSLEVLEHNLEVAMRKVRSEKDRKIGGEISYLQDIIRGRQEERYGLCDKVNTIIILDCSRTDSEGRGMWFDLTEQWLGPQTGLQLGTERWKLEVQTWFIAV